MTSHPEHASTKERTGAGPILVLTEGEIRRLVQLDADALDAVERAFVRLAEGRADVPPVVGFFVPERDGEVDVKGAYIHGLPSMAVKIASGFFQNSRAGLPNSAGLMVVVSTVTGFPEAVLLDNGYLTEVRTALAGAAAARRLAPALVRTVGVIGAGTQGRYQLRALRIVRPFDRVLVHDQHAGAADAYVQEMRGAWPGVSLAACDAETAVRESDLVITCTPSHVPIVKAEWLHPGLHITAMGGDTAEKQELESRVLARADRLVCDFRRQCVERGELRHALADGAIGAHTPVTELGAIVAGEAPGRERQDDVTVCMLTGVGVQDTAIATLALERARRARIGAAFPGPGSTAV